MRPNLMCSVFGARPGLADDGRNVCRHSHKDDALERPNDRRNGRIRAA
jgi:hypothetical protein